MAEGLAYVATLGFAYGMPLAGLPLCLCKSVKLHVGRPDIRNGVWYWDLACVWSSQTESGSGGGDSGGTPPTERPPRIMVRQGKFTDVARFDIASNPVVNSAGDPVRREYLRSRPIFVIDKAVSDINGTLLMESPTGLLFSRNEAAWNPFGSTPTSSATTPCPSARAA